MLTLKILLGTLFVSGVIASIVFWFIGFIGSIARDDLKNNRWLWILLIFFVNPVGLIVYFFMENRKTYGIWTIIINALILILIPLYAMGTFITTQNF